METEEDDFNYDEVMADLSWQNYEYMVEQEQNHYDFKWALKHVEQLNPHSDQCFDRRFGIA